MSTFWLYFFWGGFLGVKDSCIPCWSRKHSSFHCTLQLFSKSTRHWSVSLPFLCTFHFPPFLPPGLKGRTDLLWSGVVENSVAQNFSATSPLNPSISWNLLCIKHLLLQINKDVIFGLFSVLVLEYMAFHFVNFTPSSHFLKWNGEAFRCCLIWSMI